MLALEDFFGVFYLKVLEKNSIYSGNPAKFIRKRI